MSAEASFKLQQTVKHQKRVGDLIAALCRDGWTLEDLQALTENHTIRLDARVATRNWAYDRVINAICGLDGWETMVRVWDDRTVPPEVWEAERHGSVPSRYPTSDIHVREYHFLNRGYLSDIVRVQLAKSETKDTKRICYTIFVRLNEYAQATFDFYSADGRLLGGSHFITLDILAEAIYRITQANPS